MQVPASVEKKDLYNTRYFLNLNSKCLFFSAFFSENHSTANWLLKIKMINGYNS